MRKKLKNLKILKSAKIISLFLLISSLIIFSCCLYCRFLYCPFNSSDVKDDIKHFSSDEFKGRLCGSIENERVKDEIQNSFKSYNIAPFSDTYENKFTVTVPVKNSTNLSFNIIDNNGNVLKHLTPGIDYKEDLLNFRTNNINLSKKDNIEIFPNSIVINKDNKSFLFYVTFDKNFSFRSSFISTSKYEFAIQINTNTYNEILDNLRKGHNLSVNIPYDLTQKEVSNIACIIKGTSKNLPPLILTAHFDHLGCDSLNNIYNGALDNASGICFLLNLAKNISSLPSPKRDIIFVALNAEEFGIIGSRHFAEKYKDSLMGASIINLDMIGAKDYALSLLKSSDSQNKNSNILTSLENICRKKNIPYNILYEDSSDHAGFSSEYYDSITITQSDMINIHTPRDIHNKISTKDINKVYNVIYCEILSSCYDTEKLFFYKNSILYIFATTSSIFIVIYFSINIYYKKSLN